MFQSTRKQTYADDGYKLVYNDAIGLIQFHSFNDDGDTYTYLRVLKHNDILYITEVYSFNFHSFEEMCEKDYVEEEVMEMLEEALAPAYKLCQEDVHSQVLDQMSVLTGLGFPPAFVADVARTLAPRKMVHKFSLRNIFKVNYGVCTSHNSEMLVPAVQRL